MNKALIILKREFTQTVRRRSFILLTLSIPLIAILGMLAYQIIQGMEAEPEKEEEKIGYVDATEMFTGYKEGEGVTFIQYATQDKAKKDLLAEEIDEYFIIPEDYLETGQVIRYTTERELKASSKVRWQISEFLLNNLLAGKTSEELLQRVKQPLNLASLQLDKTTGEVTEAPHPMIAIFVPYIFGLLFVFSIFFTSGYLLQSVSEEKENRVIEILLSSISARQLLSGKVLGLGAAGLLQIVVWLVTIVVFARVASMNIPVLSDLSVPIGTLGWGILCFVLGYLLFAVIFSGLGSISGTARESQQWTGLFTMPAVVPLILMSVLAEHPDGIVAKVLTFIPLTAPVTIMMRLPNMAIPAWELALSLIILIGTIALGLWFVAKVFRVYLLMYGKRPTPGEIIRYIREG
ncbi:MAG: ABC transporter permease [Dehalococcoidia bacterium]